MSYDPVAAERVRRLLSGRRDVAEKKMVGGLSFLVNGNMCCGITGTVLMVRVDVESREQALRAPHARPMLFAGRARSGSLGRLRGNPRATRTCRRASSRCPHI